jgi:hypothetical protein
MNNTAGVFRLVTSTAAASDPLRLPFHAQQVTKRLQIARVWL